MVENGERGDERPRSTPIWLHVVFWMLCAFVVGLGIGARAVGSRMRIKTDECEAVREVQACDVWRNAIDIERLGLRANRVGAESGIYFGDTPLIEAEIKRLGAMRPPGCSEIFR